MNHLFAPRVGEIVWCQFPDIPIVDRPGAKTRPVLVLDITRKGDGRTEVLVAYGTSQNTNHRGRGEFTVDSKNAASGLAKPTKFCLRSILWLPATAEFFHPNPNLPNGSAINIGTVPTTDMRSFHTAAVEAGLA